MSSFKWSLCESYRFVKKRREVIGPEENLRIQLLKYEKFLRGTNSFDGVNWELPTDLIYY